MEEIKVLIFDWGDTVMRDFPEYPGPMVSWPRVEAVPGVYTVLEALHPKYIIALATNADVSTGKEIRAALGRAGLSAVFSRIYAASELGVGKDNLAYYELILRDLDVQPEEALMTGDNYANDVANAYSAGLRTAWFNPGGSPCPVHQPLHDLELRRLEGLPTALERPLLPSVLACLAMHRSVCSPPNLVAHCQAVAGAAYWLAVWLLASGENLQPLLAHRGALLHDLDKTAAGRGHRPHGQYSAEILAGLGYPDLAEIAARHVIDSVLGPGSAPRTWEEKLVYYADKMVEGDLLVGVESRINALAARYPEHAGSIQASLPAVLEIEQSICSRLGVEPGGLYKLLITSAGLLHQA